MLLWTILPVSEGERQKNRRAAYALEMNLPKYPGFSPQPNNLGFRSSRGPSRRRLMEIPQSPASRCVGGRLSRDSYSAVTENNGVLGFL